MEQAQGAKTNEHGLYVSNIEQVGFVGWRGMVGSVLLERMLAEKDFDQEFEATFFTTSNVGGKVLNLLRAYVCVYVR